MSDGSDELRILDPVTFAERRRIKVTAVGAPLRNLNELEYVKGEIFANVWQTDYIARIAPDTGKVSAYIDLRGLLTPAERAADVLNGIAYDAVHDRLFVTGKWWPKLFEIKLTKMRFQIAARRQQHRIWNADAASGRCRASRFSSVRRLR